jgi:hypothetical protein
VLRRPTVEAKDNQRLKIEMHQPPIDAPSMRPKPVGNNERLKIADQGYFGANQQSR